MLVYNASTGEYTRVEEEGERTLFEAYCEQEQALTAANFHGSPDWWLDTLCRFWASGKRKLVLNCGRRGTKSTHLGRIGVVEVVDRAWTIPVGDPPHVFPFFSIKRGEAMARLDTVEQILLARGVPHVRTTDALSPVIFLEGKGVCWRALPANFRTAVGFTSVGAAYDELARWIDTSASANPATHVLASVTPSLLTHVEEGAHEYLSSSPWAEEGAHWDAVALGDTDEQMVASAPTWVANPTYSMPLCRSLCAQEQAKGEAVDFDRDYGAVAMKLTAVGKLDPQLVDWLDKPSETKPGDMLVCGSDLGMKKNSSTLVRGFIRDEHYHVTSVHEWQPAPDAPLRPTTVCAEQRTLIEQHGAAATMADGHYRESLVEAFLGTTLTVIPAPSSAVEPLVRLRALMADGKLHVAADALRERLERQMKETRLVPTQNGLRVLMGDGKDGSHCDIVAALALMTWQLAGAEVEEAPKLPDGWTQLELDEAEEADRLYKPEDEDDWTGGDDAWEGWCE